MLNNDILNNDRDLLKEFEIDKMSEEEQQKILVQIQQTIFNRAMVRALESMDEKSKNELSTLVEEKKLDESTVLKIIKEKIPNFDEIIEEEIVKFRKLSLDISDKMNTSK